VSRKIVLGLVAAGTVAACAFVIGVLVHKGLAVAGAWAGVVAAVAGVAAAGAAVWGPVPRPSRVPLPPELEVPDWVVGRPAELSIVVRALVGGRAGTVGITTGLYGAGGFGKTTLAQMACADRRVRRWFGGRVYRVTVGRDVRGAAAVAAKVNDVIRLVFDVDAAFADPQLAGARLGSLLDAGPRRLLVLDDVWAAEQLAPFTEGGRGCARLVTTRVPELLAGRGTAVRVDQMTREQARALLTSGLPPLDEAVVAGLLAVTGRWPLLVRLVSQILADYAQVAGDESAVSAQGAVLLEQLAAGGPAVVDELRGDGGRGLDVGQPDQRARAVRATIEASTDLLDGQDAERFAELGVFAEDETVPFGLVARLWRATAGLDDLRAAQVCKRLAQLALVSQVSGPAGGVALHDVIRDFLRAGLGERLAELNVKLLDAVAAGLAAASPLNGPDGCPVRVAWWDLGDEDRYVWDHLIEHLLDAGRPDEAEAVAGDLRWVGARLERFGPAAPAADLATAGTPRAARRRGVLERTAHLLAPAEPAGTVVDVLHSRVADDPDWGPQVSALGDICRRPRLVNRWPLPDLADPALRRVLTGHTSQVVAVAVAPDASWLASGSWDGTVRIWDAATGRERATLTGHTGQVTAVAVAPDASWLASGGLDNTVRIWDAATGRERVTVTGHTGPVTAVAVAPDGSWLASASWDRTVRIWDAATGRQRATLTGHTGPVEAVAVAPDGSRLVSGSRDGTVRTWEAATWWERAILTGHTGAVEAVAVAPDSSWLASGGWDGTVRIWDAATGRKRATLTGQISAVAVAVAPDSSWLASGAGDGTVRIWDAATGRKRVTLTGQISAVAVAVAPDGSWLASGGGDGMVRIWDAATGKERVTLTGHIGPVEAVAVAPDGSWLASVGRDGTVRIWDAATGHAQALMRVDNNIFACAWLGSHALIVGGSAGLYLFGFLTRTSPPPAG
jgi:WD40 repeat protein